MTREGVIYEINEQTESIQITFVGDNVYSLEEDLMLEDLMLVNLHPNFKTNKLIYIIDKLEDNEDSEDTLSASISMFKLADIGHDICLSKIPLDKWNPKFEFKRILNY